MLAGKLLSRHKASALGNGALALLMHNNSASFPDSGPNAYSISNNGVTYVSGVARFGSGSAQFTGASRLAVPNGVLNTFGANDFTIELFVNFSSIRSSAPFGYAATVLVDNRISVSGSDRSWSVVCRNVANTNSHGIEFGWSVTGNDVYDFTVDYTFNVGQWYHIAVTRQGNFLRIFVDGQLIGTKADFTATIYSNTKVTGIGDLQEGGYTGTW